MEYRKRGDEYAGNQIRILLGELKNSAHNLKIKALNRFQTYIEDYDPAVADDTVDFLFTGNTGGLIAQSEGQGQGQVSFIYSLYVFFAFMIDLLNFNVNRDLVYCFTVD